MPTVEKINSPHVLDVSAAAFEDAQRDGDEPQDHHPGHVEALFKIENKRAAGAHQKRDRQQRHYPQHIHRDSHRHGKSVKPMCTRPTEKIIISKQSEEARDTGRVATRAWQTFQQLQGCSALFDESWQWAKLDYGCPEGRLLICC